MTDLNLFDTTHDLVRSRRSSLVLDATRAIDPVIVQRLLELVIAAPNHRHTRPWRVLPFVGEHRISLGEAFGHDYETAHGSATDPARLAKIRSKYGRAPLVVLIGCAPDDRPNVHREDLFAVAAGVQNLLLGATAAGLVTLWSSPPTTLAPHVAELAGFEPDTEMVAVVYVGYPKTEAVEPDVAS